MRHLLRILLTGAAVVIVAGTIASASPHLRATLTGTPASATGESGGTGATTGAIGATTGASDVSPEAAGGSEESGASVTSGGSAASGATGPSGEIGVVAPAGATGPDFSGCAGLTGLENAICRHQVLLAIHPDNEGLANALTHLEDNLSKQTPETAGTTETHDHGAEVHDNGAEVHGNGSAPHGQSGESHGKTDQPHGNGHGDS